MSPWRNIHLLCCHLLCYRYRRELAAIHTRIAAADADIAAMRARAA